MIELPTFNAGDTPKAQDFQTVVDAITELRTLVTSGGVGAQTSDTGDFPSDPFKEMLIGEATGNFTSGLSIWKEKTNVGGSIVDLGTPGTDGRQCTSSSDPSAAIALSEKQFFLVEMQDGQDMRFVMLFSGTFAVFLTQNTGADGVAPSTPATWNYDAFLDSAKTIKVGSAVSVVAPRVLAVPTTKATNGLGRMNGTTFVLEQAYESYVTVLCT